jgi:hypothetical protein
MRQFKAIMTPKPGAFQPDDDVAMVKMELTFTIGDKAEIQNPHTIIDATLSDMRISGTMRIEFEKHVP